MGTLFTSGRQGRGRGALRAPEDAQHQALPEPARGRHRAEHGGEGDAPARRQAVRGDRRVPRATTSTRSAWRSAPGQLGDDRLLGEAIAMDAFACHFLTDTFSASHTRTPRSSIEAYWDKKVPELRAAAREVARRRDRVRRAPQPERHPGVARGDGRRAVQARAQEGAGEGQAGRPRPELRRRRRPRRPRLGGRARQGPHGPLVEVAGQRFRTVGDDGLIPAVDDVHQADDRQPAQGGAEEQEGQGRGAHVRRRDAGGAGERRATSSGRSSSRAGSASARTSSPR